MNRISVLLLGAMVLPLQILAFSYSNGSIYLGEWNAGYTKGKQYAEENHLPMLLLWARKGCAMCNELKSAMNGADFQEWTSSHRIVMTVSHEGDTDSGAALSFVRSSDMSLTELPLLCVYWPKPDGTTVMRSFVGRSRSMPVKLGNLQMQLASSVETILEDAGFDFSSTKDSPTPVVVPKPSFALKSATFDEVQFLPIFESFALVNVSGGAIKLKKVAGKLPSGLKLLYDAASGCVVLLGTPSKAGTFTSGWSVSERLASGTAVGTQVFQLTLNVDAMAKAMPVFSTRAIKANGIVLSDSGDLMGLITLSLSQKGQSSVQFDDGVAKTKAASKVWSGFSDDGLLVAEGAGKGASYLLTISPDGDMQGTWTGSDHVAREIFLSADVVCRESGAGFCHESQDYISGRCGRVAAVNERGGVQEGHDVLEGDAPGPSAHKREGRAHRAGRR